MADVEDTGPGPTRADVEVTARADVEVTIRADLEDATRADVEDDGPHWTADVKCARGPPTRMHNLPGGRRRREDGAVGVQAHYGAWVCSLILRTCRLYLPHCVKYYTSSICSTDYTKYINIIHVFFFVLLE
jgi:hypothetical protein